MKLLSSGIAADRIMLGFAAALAILSIFFGGEMMLTGVAGGVAVTLAAYFIPKLRERRDPVAIRILYILYIVPSLYLLYPVAITLGRNMHAADYDGVLIAIDRFLFAGHDPTRWLYDHLKLAPLAVEILQVCYYAHYLYPLILGSELAIRNKSGELENYRMIMVYGSIISFIGNMLVPSIGPRFTLHEFANLSKELPGVWVTEPIRSMINAAEGVNAAMTSRVASLTVFRDAFPSGHTMLTLLTLWSAFHYRARVRWLLLPLGTVLIVSTILLRYHYVTDVVGGIALAALTIWSTPYVIQLIAGKSSTT